MDDRFHTENQGLNKPSEPTVPPRSVKPGLGDFSENINSTFGQKPSGAPVISSSARTGKFQVHLPEDADLIPDIIPSVPVSQEPVLKNITGREYLEAIEKKAAATEVKNTVPAPTRTNTAATGGTASAPQGSAQRRTPPVVRAQRNQQSAPTVKKAAPSQKKPSSAGKGKSKADRRYSFINSVLSICVCVIFVTILTVTASTIAMATINDILVIDKRESDYVSVVIPEGSEYEEVFGILKDAELVKQPLITNLFCKFRNYHQIDVRQDDGSYKTVRIEYEPGVYYLDANMGVESMLESMMVSKNNSKDTVRLTFPEGWTIAQIFEKIEKYEVCGAEKLYANLELVSEQYDFISEIENVNGRYLKTEGYLFPDTYDFFIGENASSVIKKLLNNFENRWKEEYNDRLKELDMTMDEIVTIASIIQREAKNTTQMDVISSVIHNRLNDRATYPSVDMNSTKDYVLSLKEFNLFSDFYYNLYLNSYNTYSNPGLPPGPICNPGAAAIRAALYPEDTTYCFFCHDDSGNIYLASTASEHQANTEKVLYGG